MGATLRRARNQNTVKEKDTWETSVERCMEEMRLSQRKSITLKVNKRHASEVLFNQFHEFSIV